MTRILVVLPFFLVLGACTLFQPKQPEVVIPNVPVVAQKTTVVIPQSLLQDCQPLSKLVPNQAYNQGQFLDAFNVWDGEHTDCMLRFNKLRDLTAKAFNIQIVPQNQTAVPAVPTSAP
jgi:hypothetical protein